MMKANEFVKQFGIEQARKKQRQAIGSDEFLYDLDRIIHFYDVVDGIKFNFGSIEMYLEHIKLHCNRYVKFRDINKMRRPDINKTEFFFLHVDYIKQAIAEWRAVNEGV